MKRLFLAVPLFSLGCAGVVDDPPDDTPIGRTTFAFEPIAVDGLPSRWGAPVAPGVFFGGVNADMVVQQEVFALTPEQDTLKADVVATMDVPRFCACGIHDENRGELLLVGGRDGNFLDEQSTVLVNLTTNEQTPIDHAGAALTPVGCQAFFSKTSDRGYIFGGLASGTGFSGDTYRYDPEARTITKLEIAGPAARYDAGIMELADGSTVLAGGMGMTAVGAPEFFSDVWRFDPESESWTEIPTTSETIPEGRRYAWTAMAPDESLMLYGFGSDSPRGESVLGDLWSFDMNTGAWSELDVEGERPEARGFTYRLAGPPDSAGILVGGSDATLNVFTDAFVLRVPSDLEGDWR
jgi:hypothetical protein